MREKKGQKRWGPVAIGVAGERTMDRKAPEHGACRV